MTPQEVFEDMCRRLDNIEATLGFLISANTNIHSIQTETVAPASSD